MSDRPRPARRSAARRAVPPPRRHRGARGRPAPARPGGGPARPPRRHPGGRRRTRAHRADPRDGDLSLRGPRHRRGQRHGRVRGGARPPGASGGVRGRWLPRGPRSQYRRGTGGGDRRGRSRARPGRRAASASPLVAPECRAPAFDEWFTGVGAGRQALVGARAGQPRRRPGRRRRARLSAVDGPVDAPALRGVAVPAGPWSRSTWREEVPRRDDLALHVTTTRGRVSATVLRPLRRARLRRLGHRLPAVAGRRRRPANLMLGLPDGSGRATWCWPTLAETETRASRPGRHRGLGVRRRGHRGHRRPAGERRPGLGRDAAAREERGRRDRACSSSPAPR